MLRGDSERNNEQPSRTILEGNVTKKIKLEANQRKEISTRKSKEKTSNRKNNRSVKLPIRLNDPNGKITEHDVSRLSQVETSMPCIEKRKLNDEPQRLNAMLFSCNYCLKQFHQIGVLEEHVLIHTENNSKSNKEFASDTKENGDKKMKLKENKVKRPPKAASDADESTNGMKSLESPLKKCARCGNRFPKLEDLQQHFSSVHGKTAFQGIVKKEPNDFEEKLSTKTPEIKKKKSTRKNKSELTHTSEQNIKRIKMNEKSSTAGKEDELVQTSMPCEKESKTDAELKSTMLFCCNYCKKNFDQVDKLEAHVTMIHTGTTSKSNDDLGINEISKLDVVFNDHPLWKAARAFIMNGVECSLRNVSTTKEKEILDLNMLHSNNFARRL